MKNDPIVEEVRNARQKILEECGGDLQAVMDRYKDAEKEHSGRMITKKALQQRLQKKQPRFPRLEANRGITAFGTAFLA
jgi:hypothetical protein